MAQRIIQWFYEGRAGALAFGAALVLLLGLSGCSGAENATSGSESANSQQEPTREQTTTPPTTSTPEEQSGSENEDEERAQQRSSGDGAVSRQEPEPQQPDPKQSTGEQEAVQGENGLSSRGKVVTVSRVVDGDTIEVSPAVNGIQDVRLIGVDTPETYGGEEPLGPQASAFATDALAGQKVALDFGQERVDPYGRALAYVWVSEGSMFNAQLLREGLAQVATFPPNMKYVGRFEAIQDKARASGIGIWGLSQAEQCELADRGNGIGEGSPGCTAPEPEPTPAPKPAPQQPSAGGGGSAPPVSEDDCTSSHPIKGNESSGIYHPPSGGSYDVTNPEVCFASGAAAEAAGYRAAQN